MESFDEVRASLSDSDQVVVALGGQDRQRSVANGLALVSSDEVVIHDAARPFATDRMVADVLAALSTSDGAITAVPVAETLKRAAGDRVLETVTREDLYRAQTPQAFRADKLRMAHEQARDEGWIDATDDAQLIERYGGTVRIVEGAAENLKITSEADWNLAEALVASR